MVRTHFHQAKPGYRDGVLLVPLPPQEFYTGIVKLAAGDRLGAVTSLGMPEKSRGGNVSGAGEGGKSPAKRVECGADRHQRPGRER